MSKSMTHERLDEIKNTLFPDSVQPMVNELILEVEYLTKRISFLRKQAWATVTDITDALQEAASVRTNLLKIEEMIEKIFE